MCVRFWVQNMFLDEVFEDVLKCDLQGCAVVVVVVVTILLLVTGVRLLFVMKCGR